MCTMLETHTRELHKASWCDAVYVWMELRCLAFQFTQSLEEIGCGSMSDTQTTTDCSCLRVRPTHLHEQLCTLDISYQRNRSLGCEPPEAVAFCCRGCSRRIPRRTATPTAPPTSEGEVDHHAEGVARQAFHDGQIAFSRLVLFLLRLLQRPVNRFDLERPSYVLPAVASQTPLFRNVREFYLYPVFRVEISCAHWSVQIES